MKKIIFLTLFLLSSIYINAQFYITRDDTIGGKTNKNLVITPTWFYSHLTDTYIDDDLTINTTKQITGKTLDLVKGSSIGLLGGATYTDDSRTDASEKRFYLASYHYTNAEEPLGVFFTRSTATNSYINIGSGSTLMNAPTVISLYTAANTTTVTGTETARIENNLFTSFVPFAGTSANFSNVVTVSRTGAGANNLRLINSSYNSTALALRAVDGTGSAFGFTLFDEVSNTSWLSFTYDGGAGNAKFKGSVFVGDTLNVTDYSSFHNRLDLYAHGDLTRRGFLGARGDIGTITSGANTDILLRSLGAILLGTSTNTTAGLMIDASNNSLFGGNISLSTGKSLTITNGSLNVIAGSSLNVYNYMYHDSDSNTKIGFPSNDNIDMYAGGARIFSADVNGVVIGENGVVSGLLTYIASNNNQFKISINSNDQEVHTGASGGINITGGGGSAYVAGFGVSTEGQSYFADAELNFGFTQNANYAGWINYRGYAYGSTQFRDLYIGNGKNSAIALFDGSDKSSNFYGNVVLSSGSSLFTDINGNLYTGNLRFRNKADDGWIAFADRNTSGSEAVYDLSNIGLVSAQNMTLDSLPTYADDTAAGSGGLTAGQFYKTSSGAVMVKL